QWVVRVARREGWTVYHVPLPTRPVGDGKFVPDRRGRGLPDLVMFHDDPPRLIFAELKADKGVVDPAQADFLRRARAVATASADLDGYRCIGVYLWRPGSEELVETILRSRVAVA